MKSPKAPPLLGAHFSIAKGLHHALYEAKAYGCGALIRNETSYRQVTDEFDAVIGIENLYAMHLNDSKKELGSRVDRHEHI